jgi:hypothetical protein
MRRLAIKIEAIGKNSARAEPVCAFTVVSTTAILIEGGESYLNRGWEKQTETDPAEAFKAAVRVKAGKDRYPLADKESPISLGIYYDTKRILIESSKGQGRVPEAGEKVKKVSFVLRRKGAGKERYAVVLKINGESTLFKERLPDEECAKWVLEPGGKPITIEGFYLSKKKQATFRIQSPAESKKDEVRYGADAGLITVVVFREQKGPEKPPSLDDDVEFVSAIARGLLPEKRPKNLAALKAQLREGVQRGVPHRGLIVAGKEKDVDLRLIEFKADPVPVLVATIRYYKPTKK